eukprot:6199633-Pleurochrysis_carterae.AAC.2
MSPLPSLPFVQLAHSAVGASPEKRKRRQFAHHFTLMHRRKTSSPQHRRSMQTASSLVALRPDQTSPGATLDSVRLLIACWTRW